MSYLNDSSLEIQWHKRHMFYVLYNRIVILDFGSHASVGVKHLLIGILVMQK